MSTMYPLFADVADRAVLVIGGGHVAERKVLGLLESGAQITVVSPELTKKLAELHADGQIEVCRCDYQRGDLAGAWLVIAATDDEQINRQIFTEANERHIFCNVVDRPELCSFQVPAVVRRGDLQIAVSTSGTSPILAKLIRQQLQKEYGKHYEIFPAKLGELRAHYKKKYPDNQSRRGELLEEFVNSEALDLLQQGKFDDFQALLNEWKDR
ncbi:MAG: bifunctional precorrin-2 dehydrogenase/sirohydrochlorin ferrochelatase [Sedimentisphaerales bacterium]|nr:bifunctional precorrin-2 dehydrogenase/sirohydrochlorin ferrochelatase [Sedimentisphaerales bacterium]